MASEDAKSEKPSSADVPGKKQDGATEDDDKPDWENWLLCLGGAVYLLYLVYEYFEEEKTAAGEKELEAANHTPGYNPAHPLLGRFCERAPRAYSELDDAFARFEALGFTYGHHRGNGWGGECWEPYWNEGGFYCLAPAGAEMIEQATYTLHGMCLAVVDAVVNDDELMDLFEIDDALRPAIRRSWAARESDLIGRFDLFFDGDRGIKLLEYNADTPTVLAESAAAQQLWLQETKHTHNVWTYPRGETAPSQFNRIDELLVTGFQQWAKWNFPDGGAELGFAYPEEPSRDGFGVEEHATVSYLAEAAKRAGIDAKMFQLAEIHRRLDDGRTKRGSWVWKLYPWEWIADEPLIDEVEDARVRCSPAAGYLFFLLVTARLGVFLFMGCVHRIASA